MAQILPRVEVPTETPALIISQTSSGQLVARRADNGRVLARLNLPYTAPGADAIASAWHFGEIAQRAIANRDRLGL